ncbi:MAG TPA: hypothetical protein VGW74_17980 [Propionibacteriaceae bacterium]|nr:hypothetical protein [Propionibacteriaceae bacterium]
MHAVDGRPLHDAPDPKDDPNFLAHQKAADGNGKLDRGLAPHLGIPDDFVDWHWATQLNQARAVTYAIDHYRRWWPRTAGAVVWQLNDCWPVTSWAAIDSLGRPKPLWYALRRAFAPRNLAWATDDEQLSLAVLNDTDQPWRGEITFTRERFDGKPIAQASMPVDVGPRSSTPLTLPSDVASPTDPRAEVVTARLDGCTAVHTFAEDIDLALDPDPLLVAVDRVADGYAVTVTARSLARDITLHPDRVAADATVDEALVTLRAGEHVTFQVRTQSSGLEQVLAGYPVLRTANDLQRT